MIVTVTNNLFDQLSGGIGIRLNADVRNIVFQRNTLVFSPSGGLTTVQFAPPQYPSGNNDPASLALVYPGWQSLTYTFANGLQNVGVDIAAIQAATAGVVVP